MKLDTVLAVVVLSVFFYTSQLFLSPVYLFFAFFLVLVSAFFLNKNTHKIDYNFYFGSLGFVYAIIIFMNVTDYGTYTNYIMCMLLIVFYPLLFNKHRIKITKALYFSVYVLLALYAFEAIYRFLNPVVSSEMLNNTDESLLFYQFKFNSVMFTDSNFVALSLMCLLYFIIIAIPKGKVKGFLIFSILLLIVLTLSRAVYISTLALLFFHYARFKYKVILSVFVGIASITIIPYILNDGSFLSKLKIINIFIAYLSEIDFVTLLLGSGIGTSADVLGIGSHNLFVLLVVEFGFISLVWFLFYVVCNILFSSFRTLPFWVAITICGFSLGSMYAFIFLPPLVATYMDSEANEQK